MKIFISWSGETSHQVALVLRDWLPIINSSFKPWVSSEDIQKGKRWGIELARELDEMSFGIICLDQSNLNSPWLHFEAGAISKSINSGYVVPLLFHVSPSQLEGPLSLFQATTFNKTDILKLLLVLNEANTENQIPKDSIIRALDYSWRTLEEKLGEIQEPGANDFKQQSIESNQIQLSNGEKNLFGLIAFAAIEGYVDEDNRIYYDAIYSEYEFASSTAAELKSKYEFSWHENTEYTNKLIDMGMVNIVFDQDMDERMVELTDFGRDFAFRTGLLATVRQELNIIKSKSRR